MFLSLLKIVESTTVDGPGFRISIYCAGCENACKGCHNPQSWDIKNGVMTDVEEIYKRIVANDMENVTFSGGDPMFQPEAFTYLAKKIKENTTKTIWCYSGYVYEQLVQMPKQREMLNYIDVLVDGPYIEALHDADLVFRGSKNQRLIDVQKSLKNGQVELFEYKIGL